MNMDGAVLQGFYDYRLVLLSIFIAILAAYAALDLAGLRPMFVDSGGVMRAVHYGPIEPLEFADGIRAIIPTPRQE